MTLPEFREYRLRYNVKMTEIAKEMGVTKAYINNLERGHKGNENASEETIQRLLNALYVIVDKRNKAKVRRIEREDKLNK